MACAADPGAYPADDDMFPSKDGRALLPVA